MSDTIERSLPGRAAKIGRLYKHPSIAVATSIGSAGAIDFSGCTGGFIYSTIAGSYAVYCSPDGMQTYRPYKDYTGTPLTLTITTTDCNELPPNCFGWAFTKFVGPAGSFIVFAKG